MGESFQGVGRRSRLRARDDRRNHRPGAPARRRRKRGTQKEAIGRSRGGLSTKIHIAVDTLGHPLRLILTAGQVHESTQASALIEGLTLVSLIGDKGYRQRRLSRATGRSRDRRSDPTPWVAHRRDRLRRKRLRPAPSHRVLHQQDQTLPAHRYTLREDGLQLLLDALPRSRYDLAALNVNTT